MQLTLVWAGQSPSDDVTLMSLPATPPLWHEHLHEGDHVMFSITTRYDLPMVAVLDKQTAR